MTSFRGRQETPLPSDPERDRPLDVGALADDLQRRAHASDPGSPLFPIPPGEHEVRLNPVVPASTRAVIGPMVNKGRRAVLRSVLPTLDDLALQVSTALDDLTRIQMEIDALRGQALGLAAIEVTVREIEGRLRDIEGLALSQRLSRLESSATPGTRPTEPAAGTPVVTPIAANVAALAPERARVDDTGDERFAAYWATLEPSSRVLDLSSHPEARQSLRAQPFQVAEGDEDALAALAGHDALGGVVAIGTGDHWAPEQWLRIAPATHAALRDGGVAVFEVTNSTTPAALAFRSRQPGLPAPTHPDTIAYLLRAAGFSDVEVRYLGAFPDDQRAPIADDPDWFEARLNGMSAVINELVVGQPLAAVLARR